MLSVSLLLSLFLFAIDDTVSINTIHQSIPRAKERDAMCLLVCFAHLQGEWGGVKRDCGSRRRLTKQEDEGLA